MKKIIFAAAALIAFGFANAQDKKESTGGKGLANGDIFISGSVGITSSKTGDFKTSGFNIMPKVGFMITDNIAIGGMIGYESDKTDDGITDSTVNTLSIGAFGRWYATPANDFSMFVELGANYHSSDDDATDVKVNGFGVALAPGIHYFISDHFALETSIAALSFDSSKPDTDGAEQTTTFGLGLDLTDVTVGLIYKF